MRSSFRLLLLIATVLIAGSAPALCAPRWIELVPMVGYQGGAEFSADVAGTPPAKADPAMTFGLTLGFGLQADTWLEAIIERQSLEFSSDPAAFGSSRFEVNVDHLQFGACYGPAREGLRPFVAASIGLTHFGASGASVESSTGLSGSLGGGFQVPLGERVALRLEARGYAVSSGGQLTAACGAGCVVRFSSDGWFQLGARAGLAIRM